MNDQESNHKQTSRATAVNSSNWHIHAAIAIIITALITGTGGYLLGLRTNTNASQNTQIVSLQPSPTIIAYPSVSALSLTSRPAMPTLSFKIYRNERLGFEFKYLEGYEVMEETTSGVSFGANGFVYLTISTNQITDYKSYKPCEYGVAPNAPCLAVWDTWQEGASVDTILGGVSAKSFDLIEGVPDGTYRIVQTTGSPKIEVKMFVAGGGLGWQFNQMLSTFKFILVRETL